MKRNLYSSTGMAMRKPKYPRLYSFKRGLKWVSNPMEHQAVFKLLIERLK